MGDIREKLICDRLLVVYSTDTGKKKEWQPKKRNRIVQGTKERR